MSTVHPTEEYFETIEDRLEAAIALAERARGRGADPRPTVEIPVAQDMADRVENLLGIDGVADRVRELESEMSREEAALELARDFAEGRVGSFETRAETIEGAVRTAVALLTEGVVAAPIEGIDGVEILTNDDGTEFVNVYYAGPLRSAGGTAQALSVLVADYARTLLGLEAYTARTEEIERYTEELGLYDDEVGLQYAPADEETKYIARNLPVMLDGEPTSDGEVSGYRDIDRVDTNNARGGMCLVLGEGIAQKASKIKRYTDQLESVEWPWLEDLIEGSFSADEESSEEATGPTDDGDTKAEDGPPRADPSTKFLTDLIAGRPVLSHPSEPGGFRLRYGRARNHGFATAGVHPATMHLVDDFLATGTQLKTERPGKAAGVVPVDSIEGPTVKLASGEVRRIDDPAEALEIRNGVDRIVDLGEYLVNVGEFVENNQDLAPAGYTLEWWRQELAAAGADVQAFVDDSRVDLADPSADRALAWAETHGVPLHPTYTYQWHDLSVTDYDALADAAADGHLESGTLVLEATDLVCRALETIVVEHTQGDQQVTVPDPAALLASLGVEETPAGLERTWVADELSAEARTWADGENAIRAVNEVAPFTVRERAPTRVGARMGRPEKSERRQMKPAVHTLYPIGEGGGDQRDVGKATAYRDTPEGEKGVVTVEVARLRCPSCESETPTNRCPDCDTRTERAHHCRDCDRLVATGEAPDQPCPACDAPTSAVQYAPVDVGEDLTAALERVGERESAYEILKGVKGLTSAAKRPEPLEKGILRAKHDVSTFKDGTVRYDMTDLPVTAVRPAELDVTATQLRQLGYERDVHGDPLEHDDQLVELKVQDIVLSDGAATYLLQTADFVDDLLTSYYGLEPYYEVEERADLVGELVFGMAPHTSAAVVGRVVGFTSAAVGYAHPFFHAAKRRNCDGDEDCVMLLMDGLLNFSRTYLPSSRGGRMDAPLVMTSRVDPAEIDDEAHNVDVVDEYPLAFFEATRRQVHPSEIDIELAADTVGTPAAYTGFEHTHDTSDIALGPDLSAYKTLGSMTEKMDSQLELARTLRAVDETDVAERVIEYHFLPDLIGNLRAFCKQETRCHDCGYKYRRMPLTRECRRCGGNVTLTVHEGSVTKYLETAVTVAEEYGCREYTKQRLEVLDRSIESIFQNDKNRPSSLEEFM